MISELDVKEIKKNINRRGKTMARLVIEFEKPVTLEAGKTYCVSIVHKKVTIKEIIAYAGPAPVYGKTIYENHLE